MRKISPATSASTFTRSLVQPLREAFTSVAATVQKFSARLPPSDAQPLQDNLQKLVTFIPTLDSANDLNSLQSLLGRHLSDSFGYFHNLWVVRYYLPTAECFVSELAPPELKQTLTQASKAGKDVFFKFNDYLKLRTFFQSTANQLNIESALKEAEEAVTRTRHSLWLSLRKRDELLLFRRKLNELRLKAPTIESCRSVCDAFDRVKTILEEDVFHGPLPPVYRVQGFRVEQKMAAALKHSNEGEHERLAAFPLTAPLDRTADSLEAVQVQRTNMRAKYRHALEEFRREVAADIESGGVEVPPVPAADAERAQKKAERACERATGAVRAKLEPRIERLRRRVAEAQVRAEAQETAALERRISGEITQRRTDLVEMERSTAAAFASLHAVMAIVHRHIQTEFETLVALGAVEAGGGADPIGAEIAESGTITGVVNGLDQGWTKVAF